jgi:hypothetical protein
VAETSLPRLAACSSVFWVSARPAKLLWQSAPRSSTQHRPTGVRTTRRSRSASIRPFMSTLECGAL